MSAVAAEVWSEVPALWCGSEEKLRGRSGPALGSDGPRLTPHNPEGRGPERRTASEPTLQII